MKKVILVTFVSLVTLLTSCGYNFHDFKTTSIENGKTIVFSINEDDAKYYSAGDTVTIKNFGNSGWDIVNDGRERNDTLYFTDSHYGADSTFVPSYSVKYKNVVIEEIFKD